MRLAPHGQPPQRLRTTASPAWRIAADSRPPCPRRWRLDDRPSGGSGGGGARSAPPSPSLACLSLQELGLSASGLAAIASGSGEPHTSRPEPAYADQNLPPTGSAEASTTASQRSSGGAQKAYGHRLDEGAVAVRTTKSSEARPMPLIHGTGDTLFPLAQALTREEFDGLPLFLRSQVSLEELNVAVTRINDRVTDKRFGMMEVAPGTASEHGSDADLISPADLHAIDLGPLMKAYLLLLVRLDRLLPEHHHGATCYRLCGG
eukprot:SM000077S21614  [mRNA]  locus=s77:585936:587547:+ [translate_table: standard]